MRSLKRVRKEISYRLCGPLGIRKGRTIPIRPQNTVTIISVISNFSIDLKEKVHRRIEKKGRLSTQAKTAYKYTTENRHGINCINENTGNDKAE